MIKRFRQIFERFPLRSQVVFLLFLTLITYANTFNHEYSLDDFLLSDNLPPIEEGWKGTLTVFKTAYNQFDYRPIAVFTYAIERQLQGELVAGTSHIVNVILYFFCCMILFACLRILPVKNARLIAFIATAIFIVHPIHSNVISSLKNRDSILSLALGLTSIFLALKLIRYQHEKKLREIGIKAVYLVLAFLVFLVATTAKLDAVSYIILLPLTFFILSKNRMWLIFSGGLAFAAYAAFRYIRFHMITPRFLEITSAEESILVTENTMMLYDTMSVKISTALISLFYYLKFHLIPKGYYYYFGLDMIQVDELFIWQNVVAAAVALISLIAFIYYFLKRPEISFAIGFFYGGLAYCLNLYTPVAGIVAPRLGFIASIGFCLLLAIIILEIAGLLIKWFLAKRKWWDLKRVSALLLAIVLLIYIPFTIERNKAWKNIWTLIEADIEYLDRSFEGQRIACMNYLDKSKWVTEDAESIALIEKSLKHCMLASDVYSEDQFVEETIGFANFKIGNYQQSYLQFKKVLANFEESEFGIEYLGELFKLNNRPDSASVYFHELMTIAPDYHMGYFNYNQSMVKMNKVDEAIRENLSFSKKYPDYHFAYEGLGYLSLIKRDTITATNYFYYALDKGSPNAQYLDALKPYFDQNNLQETWRKFQNGNRLKLPEE